MQSPLILASGSPRRRELLRQIGLDAQVCAMDIDESRLPEEGADDYVRRLCAAKARAAQRSLAGEPRPILAADTTVVLDETIMGKPQDRAEALRMLRQLSGRAHWVKTGVAVLAGEQLQCAVVSTQVHFLPITPEQAEAYWRSGEPRDKAGGYGIQGLGALFVERLEGCYFNVVGLPLSRVAAMLSAVGVAPLGGH